MEEYRAFLEPGQRYLFMTGLNYNETYPYFDGFSLYDVVKIREDDSLEIYKLEECKERFPDQLDQEQGTYVPPKTLNEALKKLF